MPAVHREPAPAKLTRTLRVTGRRSDGYHLIDAEMVLLDFGDELEIEALDGGGPGRPALPSHLEVVEATAWVGPPDGDFDAGAPGGSATEPPSVPLGADNLVLRALAAVRRSARVRLTKRIPPGAGLGGGSSDAAAILRWAGVEDLPLAARLGGDVPFCVAGGRARVGGIGELIEPLSEDEACYVLCTPGFGVPTASVYRAFDELGGVAGVSRNDLEPAAIAVEPRLARVRDVVAEAAGRRPVLAGSGSTWYVECDDDEGPRLVKELVGAIEAARGRASVTLGRTTAAFRRRGDG